MSISQPLFAGTSTEAWAQDAACRDADIDLFFSSHDEEQRAALELCRSCPVQADCLRYALENGEMYGIWGGMRESDRRARIREQRRRTRERRQDEAA